MDISACERNLLDLVRTEGACPGHQLFERDFATWVVSSRPGGARRVTTCAFDSHHRREQLIEIVDTAEETGYGLSFLWGQHQGPPDLSRWLRALSFMGPIYCEAMTVDLRARTPRACEVETVIYPRADQREVKEVPWTQFLPRAERQDGKRMLDDLSERAPGRVAHVAVEQSGQVLASARVFIDRAGVAGLYGVYTAREARGQGLGSAVIESSLKWAQDQGSEFAILHSARKAVPLYEKFGFQTVGRFVSMYLSRERMVRNVPGLREP